MFCEQCGTALPDDSKFCFSCGAAIVVSKAPEVPEVPAAPEVPEAPDAPEAPEVPVAPDAPEASDAPAVLEPEPESDPNPISEPEPAPAPAPAVAPVAAPPSHVRVAAKPKGQIMLIIAGAALILLGLYTLSEFLTNVASALSSQLGGYSYLEGYPWASVIFGVLVALLEIATGALALIFSGKADKAKILIGVGAGVGFLTVIQIVRSFIGLSSYLGYVSDGLASQDWTVLLSAFIAPLMVDLFLVLALILVVIGAILNNQSIAGSPAVAGAAIPAPGATPVTPSAFATAPAGASAPVSAVVQPVVVGAPPQGATTSMVLGIVSLSVFILGICIPFSGIIPIVTGIIGAIMGSKANKIVKSSQATIGFILSVIALSLGALAVLVYFVLVGLIVSTDAFSGF